MAFPSRYARTRATQTGTASPTVAVNGSVADGDLLLALISSGSTGGTTAGSATGWETLLAVVETGHVVFQVYARRADGTEASFDPTYNESVGHACHLMHYTAGTWNDTGDLSEAVAAAYALGSGDPDPPSLNSVWGLRDIQWIAGAAWASSTAPTVTYPSAYSDGAADVADYFSWDAGMLTCFRDKRAVAEDPALIDWNLGVDRIEFTLAVAPFGATSKGSGLFFGVGF